jgi:hypothetical protein
MVGWDFSSLTMEAVKRVPEGHKSSVLDRNSTVNEVVEHNKSPGQSSIKALYIIGEIKT